MEYTIAIDKSHFNQFIATATQDSERTNALNFVGRWVDLFEKKISEFEKHDIRLRGNQSRLYEGKKRSDASYFNANASCSSCKVKYNFYIKNKPLDSASFFELLVKRNSEHLHEPKPSNEMQIRGDERIEAAEKVLLEFNGSSKAYVNSLCAAGLKNEPGENTLNKMEQKVRKIVSEYLNKDLVSTNWVTNAMYASDMAKATIKAKKLKGYVRNMEVCDF